LEILLGVGRFDVGQLADNYYLDDQDHEHDHGNTFSTWNYQADGSFSLASLHEMVKKRLPANIYRCKGVINTTEYPQRRVVLQAVGRRAEVTLGAEWGEGSPKTQIVAIAAARSIDEEALTQLFNSCILGVG
jgi:G3E family GTPase